MTHCSLVVVSLVLIGSVVEPADDSLCKEPTYVKRRIDGDVRAASPFYVVALTKTPQTEQIDNICYTYFENNDMFLHIISKVYKNGTSSQAILYKYDIEDRPGIAEGVGKNCKYHDYTLTPVCGDTVFPLYRCFLYGACSQLDVGPVEGVDVQLVLAADPALSYCCLSEIKRALSDTTELDGGEFVVLPQNLTYQCVTSYLLHSINSNRALGSIDFSAPTS